MLFTASAKTTQATVAATQPAAQHEPVLQRKADEEEKDAQNVTVQPKLTVGAPDDPYEKEADSVADKVMRMPEQSFVQRKCAGCEKEEKIHRKEDEEEKIQTKPLQSFLSVQRSCAAVKSEIASSSPDAHPSGSFLQRKTTGAATPVVSESLSSDIQSSKGQGSTLPDNTRQFMESRFNADFSSVRIHTDSTAESMSKSVNAQAFAHGNDIYFNSGKYSPGTFTGDSLLAHELTHTIQQGASKPFSANQNSAAAKPNIAAKTNFLSKKEMLHASVDTIPEETLRTAPKTREANTINNNTWLHQNSMRQTNNAAPDNRPQTFQNLQEGLPGINRKEINDNEKDCEPQGKIIQSKPELSNLHVNKNGDLHTSHSNVININNDKKLQSKEEEKEEEDEKGLSKIHEVQKKQVDDTQSRANEFSKQDAAIQLNPTTQKKTAIKSNPLNYKTDEPSSVMSSEQDRGPPTVQLKSTAGTIIQRSWLSNAWDAIGNVVSEAAEFVDRGIDAAKEWILGKIRTFVQNIPGYNIIGLILQHDPVTNAPVERSGRNILLAGLQLIPFGDLFRQVLDRMNAIDEAGAWIDARMADILALVSGISERFTHFMDRLSLDDIRNPDGVLSRVGDLFRVIFNDVIGFMTRAAGEFLEMIKRIMLRLIVDFVRTRIPRLYPLLRVALGHDPVTGEEVPRNGHNILYAAFDVTDEGREQRRQMEENGTLDRAAAWIDRGIAVFSTAYTLLRNAFTNLWSEVTIENLFSPIETFNRIYNDFAAPINLVTAFIGDLAREIIRLIKNALLRRLRDYARNTRGYYLVTVIIGKDPFTDEVVPRTVANIIHGFMSLMDGGEEQYRQMEESGAIARTTQQIEAAVARLNMTPAFIVGLFTDLWNSFRLQDLAHPFVAFRRIVNTFGEPIGRLIDFVIEIVKIIVHVILEIMHFPFDLINNIITRAMAAFESIKRDPIGFLKNLLRAIKQGFIQFFNNIGTHLLNGLTGWLMSELRDANVPAPTDFSVRGIIQWVLQVLNISMEAIWTKLAEHPRIGPQRVARIRGMINSLEGIWTFIKDVQERGIAAIWDKIQEQLSNLWNTVLEAVRNWVMEQVVNRMVARLLSMLDPTGIMAVINSAIALYNAVQSFIRYLRQILEVINSFVNGVADIAEGNVTTAANYLEATMDRAMPVVIGFLANQVGLSGVGRRIAEIIVTVRGLVDRALTWLVNRAVDTGFALFNRLMAMGRSAAGAVRNAFASILGFRRTVHSGNVDHTMYYSGTEEAPVMMVASTPKPLLQALSDRKVEIDAAAAGTQDAVNKREWKQKIDLARDKYNNDLIPAYRVRRLMNDERVRLDQTLRINEATDFIQRVLEEVKITNADFERGQLRSPVAVNDVVKSREISERGNRVTPRFKVLRIINESGQVSIQRIDHLTGSLTGPLQNIAFDNISGSLNSTAYAIDPQGASIEVLAYNNTDSWDDRNIARKVLNFRYHEVQTNPSNHDWEHVVEHTSGGVNSVDNLVLTSSQNNSDLAAAYNSLLQVPGNVTNASRSVLQFFNMNANSTEFRAFVIYVEGMRNKEGKVRDFLRNVSDNPTHRLWKNAAYLKMNIQVSNRMNRGRGDFRILN